MSKFWVPLHIHSDYSNNSMFEVVSQAEQYVERAKEDGLPAVCFTEHGNVAGWIKKKELVEGAGLKFIHGMEGYVTMEQGDKNRGYHTIIIAKNYDGVKQLNRLSSNSFNRKDGHYYYRPRIFFSELEQAMESGNLIITTACLAGALGQNLLSPDMDKEEFNTKVANIQPWIDLAKKHPQNFYFEIQPHNIPEQQHLNNAAINFASETGAGIIASNDIHALNKRHDEIRKLVKKGKGSQYESDDELELWWKTYDEMVDSFVDCGVNATFAKQALDNTVKIANQIEEFEIDKSHKYPKLYKDPEKEFQKRIKQGLKDRGILSLPKDQRQPYLDRVKHEYAVYKHNGAIDYMLSHEDIINAAKNDGRHVSYGRGSVTGSLIAYLCGQTEMDSVKLGLNFERFMSSERISLADIDVDFVSQDQQWVQKWILTNPKWHAASIMTVNTYGLKGAVKAISRGMEQYKSRPQYVQTICNQIDINGSYSTQLYEEHRELFDYAKDIVGVIDSYGRHAAGIVIDTNTIDDTMGIQTISGWDYPVTQVAMKEIDHNNWVKYDILGLDNIGLISRAAELAGLPFPTPNSDFINFEDEKVWESMREDNIGIFQMEGERAGKLLRDMLSPTTIKRIKSSEAGKNVKYMDLLSLVNAAQRPSGASYVDQVTHGKMRDNGHLALNEFLAPTLGEIVYQEQIMEWLVKFCGYTPGASDRIRRGIGKKNKEIIDNEIPKIHKEFVKTMVSKYDDSEEHAEKLAKDFIQVIIDAANYGFSVNHSMAYSYVGYISTWLRYYYPLEWCTAAFEIWKNKQDKVNKVTNFAKAHGIKIKPAEFRKSKGMYYMQRKDNSIYEGTSSIKGVNAEIGDSLYLLRDTTINRFVDLLIILYENNEVMINGNKTDILQVYKTLSDKEIKELDLSISKNDEILTGKLTKFYGANSSNMIKLISLGFFKEFGGSEKLNNVYKFFRKNYNPKNKRLLGKKKKYEACLNYEESLSDKDSNLVHKLNIELEYLGRCRTTNDKVPNSYALITSVVVTRSRIKVDLYSVSKGTSALVLMRKSLYEPRLFKKGVLIKINQLKVQPKNVLIEGRWKKSTEEKEYWLEDYKVIS